jgi:uncharacterized protein
MIKNLLLKFSLLILLCPAVSAQVYTVESVPNPKVNNNTYVSDPDNVLNSATRDSVNLIFSALEQITSDQAALVVLKSIGEEVPKDFAYRLFNKWGIGVKGKDNGLLMLMVMDQRRIEFETGYGMEGVLPDATCKRIQMNYMVPQFKEGNYDQGLLDGIKATVDILQNKENSSYFLEMEAKENAISSSENSEVYSGDNDVDVDSNIAFLIFITIVWIITVSIVYYIKHTRKSFADLYVKAFSDEKAKIKLVISKKRWFVLYVIAPLAFLIYLLLQVGNPDFIFSIGLYIYIYVAFILLEKRYRSNKQYKSVTEKSDFYDKYKKYTKAHEYWFWSAILFPIPFLFYVLYYLKQKHTLRNHPRDCKNCSDPAVKLDEVADDTHLSKAQLLEEQLKSIDYDVWYCQSCSSKQVLSYKNVFSKYSECKSCHTRAYYLQSDVTLVSATYDSTGTGEKTYKCKYCGTSHTETYTIPVKQRSSSSSSGGSSGGGGGSFGGGSSGGGGSGSSW